MPKMLNLLPDKQVFNSDRNQSVKFSKKKLFKLCVNNMVQETFGDVYCPKCAYEKCVFIPIDKTCSFYNQKVESMLSRFEYSFDWPKTDKHDVWLWYDTLL